MQKLNRNRNTTDLNIPPSCKVHIERGFHPESSFVRLAGMHAELRVPQVSSSTSFKAHASELISHHTTAKTVSAKGLVALHHESMTRSQLLPANKSERNAIRWCGVETETNSFFWCVYIFANELRPCPCLHSVMQNIKS